MKILITAFDAFGEGARNASQELLFALPARIDGAELFRHVLPTVFIRAADEAIRLIDTLQPDAVVCLGQAEGRDAVTPERVAINLMDARIPDNEGFCPCDEPIAPEGPAAYFSTLPIRCMAQAMQAAGVPARLSSTAGTYVCNSLMYALLHYFAAHRPSVPCGFIHVPLVDTQPRRDGVPALPLEDMRRALIAALGCLVPGGERTRPQ